MESNGVLRVQSKGGCEVYIGQYSHMVLHISTDSVKEGGTAVGQCTLSVWDTVDVLQKVWLI